MVSRYLLRGSVGVLTLNIILLVVLTVLTLSLTGGDRREPVNLYSHGRNVSVDVEQELRALNGFHQASDMTRLRNDLSNIYQRDGNLKKPAVHLVIAGDLNTTDDVPILSWKTLSGSSFQGDGVKYHDGVLSVTHGGYYFIYSGIRYRGDGTAELDYGRILHSVLMQKRSEMEESPTTLMQNLQSTPTIRRGRLAYTTSSLGATFYLPPNAKVMVTSSIPRNIDTSSTGSYFGLFLV